MACIECGGPAKVGEHVCPRCVRALAGAAPRGRFQFRLGPPLIGLLVVSLVLFAAVLIKGGSTNLGRTTIVTSANRPQNAAQLQRSAEQIQHRFDELHLSVNVAVAPGGLSLSVPTKIDPLVVKRLIAAGRISLRRSVASRAVAVPGGPLPSDVVLPARESALYRQLKTCPAPAAPEAAPGSSRWLVACDTVGQTLYALAPSTQTEGALSLGRVDDSAAVGRLSWKLRFGLAPNVGSARGAALVLDGVVQTASVEADGDGQSWVASELDSEVALELAAIVNSGPLISGFSTPRGY